MPFPGKSLVRAWYWHGREAAKLGYEDMRDNDVQKIRRFSRDHLLTAGIAGVFAVYNAAEAVRTGIGIEAAAASYDTVFAVAQAAAGYTQNYLSRKLQAMPVGEPELWREVPELSVYKEPIPTRSRIVDTVGSLAFAASIAAPFNEGIALLVNHL